ncbi:MAG: hypothetical protein H5T86_16585, partial [Armatimonadetes bacterium]|nr:hypothetical protein [Armatimonadota bacterium]
PADRQTEEAILYDVRPRIENFRDLGGGKFQLTYVWEVHAATSRTFHVFVHFTRPKIAPPDDIAFQNDHAPPKPTSQWRPGEVIVDGPHTVAIPEHYRQPGRIGIMVGLYDEAGRVGLGVAMTPETRCHMGDIVVEGEGETLQLRYEPAQLRPIDTTALRKAITGRLNTAHKLVDFGPVLTDGRVVIRPRGNKLAVLLVPRGQKARVGLRLSQLPAAWRSLSLGAEITRREGDILWLKVD